jgi:hypothetical protein
MSTNKKSPIKDKTLRHPGQSLDEKLDKLVNQDGTEYYFLATILLIWTDYEWWQYYLNRPQTPIPITLIAIAVVPYCIYFHNIIPKQLLFLP